MSPTFWELLAQSRVESAYFVVTRRGNYGSHPVTLLAPLAEAGAGSASLAQHGGARLTDARSSCRRQI
jgi:hypothetical protein